LAALAMLLALWRFWVERLSDFGTLAFSLVCLLVFGAVRECSLVKSAKALETKKASKSLT
jgi:hypothetical protein